MDSWGDLVVIQEKNTPKNALVATFWAWFFCFCSQVFHVFQFWVLWGGQCCDGYGFSVSERCVPWRRDPEFAPKMIDHFGTAVDKYRSFGAGGAPMYQYVCLPRGLALRFPWVCEAPESQNFIICRNVWNIWFSNLGRLWGNLRKKQKTWEKYFVFLRFSHFFRVVLHVPQMFT